MAAPVKAYVLKARVDDPLAASWVFEQQKTMYGGKAIAVGDAVFVWASEHEGGTGLVALGVVTHAEPTPRRPGPERQTPRVSVHIARSALARQPLSRTELKPFTHWDDGQPETELAFKLCRQATNKVVGVSAPTADFLRRRC